MTEVWYIEVLRKLKYTQSPLIRSPNCSRKSSACNCYICSKS